LSRRRIAGCEVKRACGALDAIVSHSDKRVGVRDHNCSVTSWCVSPPLPAITPGAPTCSLPDIAKGLEKCPGENHCVEREDRASQSDHRASAPPVPASTLRPGTARTADTLPLSAL